MLKVKLYTGQTVEFDATLIQRIRRATLAENPLAKNNANPPTLTRIDWADLYYVYDGADVVAAATQRELPTLAVLSTPGIGPVWFNAKISTGPRYVSVDLRTDGIRSSLSIGNIRKLQYVTDRPEDVAKVILDNGGTALPVLDDHVYSEILNGMQLKTLAIDDISAGS